MGKVLGAALLSIALVGGAAAHGGIVVVDVQEADGPRIVVPAPLALVRAGLVFAPDEVKRIEAREFAAYLPHAERAVSELRSAPEGPLVRAADGDDLVTVTKEGTALRIRAREGDGAAVDVVVPLGSAEAAVRAYDTEGGYFRTSELVAALGATPSGDLIDVVDGDQRVRVRRVF